MCSTEEVNFRIQESLVHALEKKNGQPYCLVKEFVRSAAGADHCCKHSSLRTPEALKETVEYLINQISTREDVKWSCIYEFVFDRLRAVRQDMCVQSLTGTTAIFILEEAVLFYLCSIQKLSHSKLAEFDPKMNSSHLQECLKQLLVQYQLDDNIEHPRRAQFESYYILIHLGHQEALRHFLSLPAHVKIAPISRRSWLVNGAIIDGNYVRVFKIIRDYDELALLALQYQLPLIYRRFLRCMNVAYSSKTCRYPLGNLVRIVGISEKELTALLADSGVSVTEGAVKFNKTSWREPGP